ncbi:MAG: M48 family metallopeptidase [Bacteroidota bacterium]
MHNSKIAFLLLLCIGLCYSGCDATKKGFNNLNLFPVDDDVRLGEQVSNEIESDPSQFPILREQGNEEVYRYIRNMTNRILNSSKVQYRDKFKWQVKIIDDPNTLNAFATPGGYIYVYTGLIKYLDSEDQLAGVMGHEIAHSDRRHSTKQMTKTVGLALLAEAALGQRAAIKQIVQGLLSLKFSRAHESESDEYSVIYLCETGYNPTGAAGFFRKISTRGSGGIPEFFSTHPNPNNRVAEIEKKAKALGCATKPEKTTEHARIKRLLP